MKNLLFTSPADINRWIFFNKGPEGPSNNTDTVRKTPEKDKNTKDTLTPVEQINIAGSKVLNEINQSSPEEVIEDAFAAIDSILETAKDGYILVGKQKMPLSPKAQNYILSEDFAKSVMEAVTKGNTEKSVEDSQEKLDTAGIQKTIDNIITEFRQSDKTPAALKTAVENARDLMATDQNLSDMAKEYILSTDFSTRMVEKIINEEQIPSSTGGSLDKQEKLDTEGIQAVIDNIMTDIRQGGETRTALKTAFENAKNLMSTNQDLSDMAKEYLLSPDFKHRIGEMFMNEEYKQTDKEVPKGEKSDTVRNETEKAKEAPGMKDKVLNLFESNNFEELKNLSGKTWTENGVKYSIQTGSSKSMSMAGDLAGSGARQAGTPYIKQSKIMKNTGTKRYIEYRLVSSSREK